jgi:hypothetical protein
MNIKFDKMFDSYFEKIDEYEANINTHYVNFKTTIDYYDQEYMIDKNGYVY